MSGGWSRSSMRSMIQFPVHPRSKSSPSIMRTPRSWQMSSRNCSLLPPPHSRVIGVVVLAGSAVLGTEPADLVVRLPVAVVARADLVEIITLVVAGVVLGEGAAATVIPLRPRQIPALWLWLTNAA